MLGPHAFLMDFRDENGKLHDDITIEDMGRKTVGNDLDNVSIHFNKVVLPRSSMLNRFAEVTENGEYKLLVPGIKPFGTSHYEVKRWPMVEALDGDDSEPMRVISSQHEHGFFACGDYLGPGPEKYGMHAALASGYLAGEQINKSF